MMPYVSVPPSPPNPRTTSPRPWGRLAASGSLDLLRKRLRGLHGHRRVSAGLVPHRAAVIPGAWKTIEQGPLSLGFGLDASGVIGMRIGNVLGGPDTP
jgi:hypothetical protein